MCIDVGVQISWAHNGVVIEPTADTTRELLSNNSLRILNVEASTKGLYACRVSNDVGTVTSRQASLQIARELSAIQVFKIFMWMGVSVRVEWQ